MTYLKKNIFLILAIIFLLGGLIYFTSQQKNSANQTQPSNNQTHKSPSNQSSANSSLQSEKSLTLDLDISQNPSLGDPQAPVMMINYSSYYCGFCSAFKTQIFPQIKEKYIDAGLVYYIYKDAGSPTDNVFLSAHCANEQNQFWAYQNLLIEKGVKGEEDLLSYAQELNLDTQLFQTCLDNGEKYSPLIEAANQEMEKFQIKGIPFFIINDTAFSGLKEAEEIFKIIDDELAKKQHK